MPAQPPKRRFHPGPLTLLCTLLALGAAPLARAQGIAELYDTARAYDAAYLAARAQAEAAEFRAEQARALRRPSVSATVSAARSRSDTPTLRSNATGPTAGVSGRQPLYNPANDATVEQADRQLEVSRAELESAEQELIVRVAQTYFEVLAAEDTLDTARAGKASIAEQLASARRNFEVGTATITDTREAQARFDLGTAQEIAAENDLHIKRLALDQLVGRNGVRPHVLATPVVLPAVEPSVVDPWVALNDSAPVVRRATLAYEIARLESQKSRAGRLPTIDLEGSYQKGRTHSDGAQGVLPFAYSGPTSQSNLGITLRLPLFAGFSVENRLKETLSLEEQARNTLDAARRGAAQSTRQAFFGVQSGQAQVRALEAAESSSQLALEATQLGYKVGVRVNVDVLNAQTQLYTTRRDLARARYDVLVNGLRLRQAAGSLKPDDVYALSPLLKSRDEVPSTSVPEVPNAASALPVVPAAAVVASPLPAAASATVRAPDTPPAAAAKTPPVSQRLHDWAAAWAAKDTDRYLGYYAPDFVPPQGLDRADWEAKRQAALRKSGAIEVKIEQLVTRALGPDSVETRFSQTYRSLNYNARAAKTIVWRRIDGQWFIVSEASH